MLSLLYGPTLTPVHQFSSAQLLSRVQLFAVPWIAACQASLSITNSQSLLKLTFIESVMTSKHLILCRPLLLPPPIFPSIRVFSNKSVFCIRWPKYWNFSFSISPSNEYIQGWFPLGLIGLTTLLSKGLWRIFSSTIVWKHQFCSMQPFLWSSSYIRICLLRKTHSFDYTDLCQQSDVSAF